MISYRPDVQNAYDRIERTGLSFEGTKSLTQQQFADDCDINSIMKKHAKLGTVPGNASPGYFADVSNFGDFQQAHQMVKEAEEAFMALDSGIRDRFKNDPGLLLNFLQIDANRAEAEALGLLKKSDNTVVPPAVPVGTQLPVPPVA